MTVWSGRVCVPEAGKESSNWNTKCGVLCLNQSLCPFERVWCAGELAEVYAKDRGRHKLLSLLLLFVLCRESEIVGGLWNS